MRLLLIRHAETPSNLFSALDTAAPGPGLTELGIAQSKRLAELRGGDAIGALFASPLIRAVRTASPLAERLGLPIIELEGLREVIAGDLEMNFDLESIHTYHESAFRWADDESAPALVGGDDAATFYQRFDGAIATAVATGHEVVACVSHGMAIRSWVASRSSNVDARFARDNFLHNTAVVELIGDPASGWQVARWADIELLWLP